MRHNALLSERGKKRTEDLALQEEEAERAANMAAYTARAEEREAAVMEAFSNRERAVTFLPASMGAVIDAPAHQYQQADGHVGEDAEGSESEGADAAEEEVAMSEQEIDARQEKLLEALLVR